MAHAIHINFGKHSGYNHHSHPGGWWKFGLFAITATAVGGLVVHSLWNTGSSPVPVIPDGMTIEVAAQPLAPSLADNVVPLPPVALNPDVPAVAPVIPPAAPATAAEADTPASTEAIQKSSAAPAEARATSPAVPAPIAPKAAPQPAAQANAPAADIHGANFAGMAPLQSLAQQLNGRVNPAGVQYHDLTGDGVDEAIVPITSDGPQGDLGIVVMTERNGAPAVILTQKADRTHQGLVVSFDGSQLTVTSAAYGPTDANCCPSQITRTYYRWTGDALVVDHANTITVPQGKDAD